MRFWQVCLFFASLASARPPFKPTDLYATTSPLGGSAGEQKSWKKAVDACTLLKHHLGHMVYLPNNDTYNAQINHFWSEEAVIHSKCVFLPDSDKTLSEGLKIIVRKGARFNVRSGGHMPVRGAASTPGVLIAMSKFKNLTLHSTPNNFGEQYASITPGNTWGQVYDWIDGKGLGVSGGRVYSVGTSLALGGGFSYFSGERGWTTDDVLNFHIVLANGTVVDASKNSYSDLYWALRGGSSNYGIVTRYDLRTYPQGKVLGGTVLWNSKQTNKYLQAHADFMAPGGGVHDPKAAIMPNVAVDCLTGTLSSGITMLYNAPDPNPNALENFTSIHGKGTVGVSKFAAVVDTTKIFAARNMRNSFYTMSLKGTPESISLANKTTIDMALHYLAGKNVSAGAAIEPLSENHLKAAVNSGGDAIDIKPSRGPATVVLVYARWNDASLDNLVEQWSKATIAALYEKAAKAKLTYNFTFLNDAGPGQDPFATYGDNHGANKKKMARIATKYDPAGVFQKLTGGFKVTA